MKKIFFLLFALILFLTEDALAVETNLFIGTGGAGYGVGATFPGATLPFGMVRLSPDTTTSGINPGFSHCAGYYYPDKEIRGFSHTHLSGIGISDYGNIMLMPTGGDRKPSLIESSYRSRFSHRREKAEPGYYSVILEDHNIKVELSATNHCGIHRYRFPSKIKPRVVLDLSHTSSGRKTCDAYLKIEPARNEASGFSVACGGLTKRGGGVKIYFVVDFNSRFSSFGVGEGARLETKRTEISSTRAGAYFDFEKEKNSEIIAKVGISLISEKQARKNLEEEIPDFDFEKTRKKAQEIWQKSLGRIEIKGASPDQRAIFYTALYHTLLMPTDYTESDSLYLGFDGRTHKAEGFHYYSDFSLWDTFRTLHPWLIIFEPERTRDMVISLLKMREQGGYIPKWPTANIYTNCMIGTSADNFIADAYLKGIRGFDIEEAFQALKETALYPTPLSHPYKGREGIEEYKRLGYVPCEKFSGSVSMTLEYSYSDWCISNLALLLGKLDDFQYFLERSKNYKNLWDKKSGFFIQRESDGDFKKPFSKLLWTRGYVEGNSWQWLFVPFYDPDGLIELMGGKEVFQKRLEKFFSRATKIPDTIMPDIYYWHGNEPDIHSVYLFNYADKPELTQKWARWIMENKYKNSPDGLDGNDDCGTLSAWYIFSALGFYPVSGSDIYLVGSPIFEEVIIQLSSGKKLIVRAKNVSSKNIYVESFKINGKKWDKPFFSHSDIANGGEIVFSMTSHPGSFGN